MQSIQETIDFLKHNGVGLKEESATFHDDGVTQYAVFEVTTKIPFDVIDKLSDHFKRINYFHPKLQLGQPC